ncbi:MAG: hypothetical protein ACHQX4_01900 [Gemmatimonadales bacterium]
MATKTETTTPSTPTFAPRWPTLAALGILTVFVVVLFLPAFAGKLLVSPNGDQIWVGLPIRWFGASEFHRTGSIPMWDPYMFGGLPFVGAMHGDIFYPTAWLRLLLPIDTAMNLGFGLHLVLAGFFAYLFLRTINVSWTGSVVGGIAYQLSGSVASLVQPGHDGKLFVSALMPVLLMGLVIGIRKRRLEGYGLVALAVAMGLLAPHLQMMQYALIFAGCFTLWLAFLDEQRPGTVRARLIAMGLALGAVILGFGAGMIQLYPFINYMPYAARVAGARGWEYATSWSMPPENIVDWLVSDFTGMGATYWGSNFVKLNSEYLGAGTLALAAVGIAAQARRRVIWFLAGAFTLFLLVSLGGHTPFYYLWYAVVPGAKVTRAEGMAFYIPTFIVACFAAFGVERLEQGEGRATLKGALYGAGALLLLGASGALGHIAESIALGIGKDEYARRHAGAIVAASLRSAVVAAAVAGVGLACLKGRIRGLPLALVLAGLLGADLTAGVWQYYSWSPPASELYADDNITTHIAKTPPPYRVLDIPLQGTEGAASYHGDFLMAKRIPQVLGHHGNEIDAYDKLLGGKLVWDKVYDPRMWDLLAVRFLVYGAPLPIGGYHMVTRSLSAEGEQILFEADTVPPYARVVPAAVKIHADQIPPTVLVQGFDPYRLVLLDESAVGIQPQHIDSLPPRSDSRARVTHWEPGAMSVRMDPAPDKDSYLVVSENWVPDWHATVDGRPARALRGQGALLTVPVPRGSRDVGLVYVRDTYNTGRLMTLLSFLGIAAWLIVPQVLRRRSA